MNVIYIFISIWIFIIIGVTIYIFKTAQKDNGLIENILLSILFNIVVLYVYFGVSCILWLSISKEEEEYSGKYIPIVSLERGYSVKGNFVLGTGSIEGEEYYYMYNSLGDNTYKLFKLPCDEYVVKETNEIPPGIRKIKITRTLGKLYSIDEEDEKIINVPKGTIIKEFKP